MVTEIELFESVNTKVLWMVTTKQKFLNFNFNLTSRWQIWYTEMTYSLQFTGNVLKSHRQPQCTSQLSCEGRVFFVKVVLRVFLCGQQHPKCQRSIHLLYPPFFCTLRSHSNLANKNWTDSRSSLSLSTIIQHYTHVFMHFFLSMTDAFTSQNIDLSSRKSLCGPTLYKNPSIPRH